MLPPHASTTSLASFSCNPTISSTMSKYHNQPSHKQRGGMSIRFLLAGEDGDSAIGAPASLSLTPRSPRCHPLGLSPETRTWPLHRRLRHPQHLDPSTPHASHLEPCSYPLSRSRSDSEEPPQDGIALNDKASYLLPKPLAKPRLEADPLTYPTTALNDLSPQAIVKCDPSPTRHGAPSSAQPIHEAKTQEIDQVVVEPSKLSLDKVAANVVVEPHLVAPVFYMWPNRVRRRVPPVGFFWGSPPHGVGAFRHLDDADWTDEASRVRWRGAATVMQILVSNALAHDVASIDDLTHASTREALVDVLHLAFARVFPGRDSSREGISTLMPPAPRSMALTRSPRSASNSPRKRVKPCHYGTGVAVDQVCCLWDASMDDDSWQYPRIDDELVSGHVYQSDTRFCRHKTHVGLVVPWRQKRVSTVPHCRRNTRIVARIDDQVRWVMTQLVDECCDLLLAFSPDELATMDECDQASIFDDVFPLVPWSQPVSLTMSCRKILTMCKQRETQGMMENDSIDSMSSNGDDDEVLVSARHKWMTDDDVSSDSDEEGVHPSQNKQTTLVEFPSHPVRTMWRLWYLGDALTHERQYRHATWLLRSSSQLNFEAAAHVMAALLDTALTHKWCDRPRHWKS
ncbi:Aste57867_12132 [Aphanomyces stellatus]|uniref:Aste57867_12132 protein n=1 Tax=Aphanomyces stellatus TaxID=120398 RepID=A0A485KUQ4_9STRA|nr:hypothetical protein As57867_012087 [Aphanomyces stellatus]VFT88986.1 Aste57867_12132 [Aphanomyces stellatus]